MISHLGFWKNQKGKLETKTRTGKHIGGTRNAALEKAKGFTTSQQITESGIVPHQTVKESLSNQSRETATRI